MNGSLQTLLAELKVGLQALYGERLQGVYLFGSYARGEQTDESDVDVLIVLDRIDNYGAEIERTGYLISPVSIQYDVSVSRILVSEAEWQEEQSPFFESVREDAIAV
jgi:predicted nucleotidyltransferase